MFIEKIKLFILKTLSFLFRLSFIRGKITVSEIFYKFLKPRYTIVKMKICDCYITLDLADQQLRYVYFNAYETAERKFLHKFLKKGDVFVDVGANYGYLSAIALCNIGSEGRVYAFEPNPKVYKGLASLTESSNKRFSAYQFAVGDVSSGKLKFYVNRSHSMLSSTLPEFAGKDDVEFFEVDTISLNEFFVDKKIDEIGLIKIDVEGGEAGVLAGLIPFLKDHRKAAIMCEISPSSDERWANVLEQITALQDLGYGLNDIDAGGNILPVSFDEVKKRTRQSNVIFATAEDLEQRYI